MPHLCHPRLRTWSACLISIALSSLVFAGDWTQWRGAGRDAAVAGFEAPSTWPEALEKAWSIETGPGLASPVVEGDRIFLFTREGDAEVVQSLNWSDGREMWRQEYPAEFYANSQATSPRLFPKSAGKGPFATPSLADGRLFTLGVNRVLSAFDSGSGELLWRRHYMRAELPQKLVYVCPPCHRECDTKEYDHPGRCPSCSMALSPRGLETSTKSIGNYYGAASSPLIAGNAGYVQVGNGERGEVVAFDPAGGEVRWRWEGPAVSSSSPVLTTIEGTRQLIVLTRTSLTGLAADDGKELWNYAIDSNAQIVTPVVLGDRIVFATYRGPLTAVRVQHKDGAWSVEEVWSNPEATLEESSPVLDGNRLFALLFSNSGQLAALDAGSGEILWQSEGRLGRGAPVLDLGQVWMALTGDAKLRFVAKRADQYQLLAQYEVAGSPTWAHPVVRGRQILVKDENGLTLWRIP